MASGHVPLEFVWPKLETFERVRVSMSHDGVPPDGYAGDATVLGTLTLGTVFVDSVAPRERFCSLAWLLPGSWVYVRPVRARYGPPLAPGEWVFARATIEWIDWPGVFLTHSRISVEAWPAPREPGARRKR